MVQQGLDADASVLHHGQAIGLKRRQEEGHHKEAGRASLRAGQCPKSIPSNQEESKRMVKEAL
jgi:hypothetical protein